MALLDANEVLKINKKIDTFVIVRADATDEEDVDLFVVKPPPAVRNTTHRAPLRSMTDICSTCRCALEYLSYYVETYKSGGDDAVEDLPAACLLHAGAQTLLEGDEAGCHLCVLIMADLRTKRLMMESIDQSNIEMCWRSKQLTPSRIHFALTHNGHERTTNNYWNFLKLQLWPCSDFGTELFGVEDSSEFECHGSTGSQQSRDRAVQWLSRCQANEDGRHDQCNEIQSDWLPTRLLDVTESLKTSALKLVTPRDHPDAFVSDKQYLTLSHCWGAWGPTALPTLTTENLSERQAQGVDVSLLPQTFKDALEIAQWFQVRWLWIDSLCIVQDSTEDWQQEAVMMYSVYKNALLNISADDSNDARWGCFRNRDPLSVCPMRLGIPGLENWTYWLTPDSNALFGAVSNAPLAKRSWVFQERQLSRRVLHFTSGELIWECCANGSYFASETFPDGAPLKSVFNDRPKFQSLSNLDASSPAELYKAWDELCHAYSEKKLSYNSDKAVALSGLAQEFQAACPGDMYVAGFWRSTFPNSLLWKSLDLSGRFDTDGYIAPSWSWLSIDGPVSDMKSSGTEQSLVDIIQVAVDPVIASEPTASLRSASLDLRCYLKPVEIQPDYEKKPWYMMAMGGGKQHKLIVKEGGKELLCGPHNNFSFSFDVPSDENSGPTSVAGCFLPICIEQPTESSETIVKGLLVEPIGDDLTAFRRIGVMSVEGPHCLPIRYRLKTHRDSGASDVEETIRLWDDLDGLLKSSYEKTKSLLQNTKDREETRGSASSSVSLNIDRKSRVPRLDGDGKEESGLVESAKANETQVRGTEAEEEKIKIETRGPKGKGKEALEAKLVINVGNNGPEEDIQPMVDLSTINTLERMYALDTAFVASELEAHFERLVPRRITLV